jgi:hypothetical protein
MKTAQNLIADAMIDYAAYVHQLKDLVEMKDGPEKEALRKEQLATQKMLKGSLQGLKDIGLGVQLCEYLLDN